VVEIHCTYDPATRGGNAPDGRKVKATIHWVSAAHAVDAEVRLYGPERPNRSQPKISRPDRVQGRPALANVEPQFRCQFERLGYFCADGDTAPGKPVFNRTVPLRDTYAKIATRADTHAKTVGRTPTSAADAHVGPAKGAKQPGPK
jgi:glutaminyl-tRNA synthetase